MSILGKTSRWSADGGRGDSGLPLPSSLGGGILSIASGHRTSSTEPGLPLYVKLVGAFRGAEYLLRCSWSARVLQLNRYQLQARPGTISTANSDDFRQQ